MCAKSCTSVLSDLSKAILAISTSAKCPCMAFIVKSCSAGLIDGGWFSRAASTPRSRLHAERPPKAMKTAMGTTKHFLFLFIVAPERMGLPIQQENDEQD